MRSTGLETMLISQEAGQFSRNFCAFMFKKTKCPFKIKLSLQTPAFPTCISLFHITVPVFPAMGAGMCFYTTSHSLNGAKVKT